MDETVTTEETESISTVQMPPVLVVGVSGSGKSSMLINLPEDRTVILNTELKPLPLANFSKFKNQMVDTFKRLNANIDGLMKAGDKVDYVVLDSFTSMTEMIDKYASTQYKGYEVWGKYNEMIKDTLIRLKKLPQQVFITALPEQKQEQFTDNKEYARIRGKELKYGFLEKEMAIVLFTHPVYAEEDDLKNGIEAGEMIEVFMDYKANKRNTAKSPRGMFSKPPKNDALYVAKAIKAFYGVK